MIAAVFGAMSVVVPMRIMPMHPSPSKALITASLFAFNSCSGLSLMVNYSDRVGYCGYGVFEAKMVVHLEVNAHWERRFRVLRLSDMGEEPLRMA